MTQTQMPREIWQKMRHDPRVYIRNRWRHPGRPQDKYDFRTHGRGDEDPRPLLYLVDDDGPLNPNAWGNINILLMARGCLKTTSVTGAVSWALEMWPMTETFMTAPTQDQVHEFMGKFKDNIMDTELENRRVRNKLKHQKFETKMKDEYGETYTVHSHLKSKSAWAADEGMRGPHSHIGVIDEFQDVDEEAFAVFLEIIDQHVPHVDYFPTIFLLGTPKLRNTFFEDMWLTSDQRTWESSDDYMDGEWIAQGEVGAYKPDVAEMDSVDADELPSFTVKGWHIDQHNSPLEAHSPDKIAFKREKYSKKKFENEVLAHFYSPEDDLLTEDHIRDAFDKELGFSDSRKYEDSLVAITVDWGGGSSEDASDTVFGVGEKSMLGDDEDDYEVEILNMKFLDHEVSQPEELRMLQDWIGMYSPDIILVDDGHGSSRREELQEIYDPQLVTGVTFGSVTPAEAVRWRQNSRDEDVAVTVYKTHNAKKMVDDFKDGRFVIPKQDLMFGSKGASGTRLINQLTAPYEEYDTTSTGKKTLKVMADRRDDAFDVFTYQWLAHRKLQEGPTLTKIGVNRRF